MLICSIDLIYIVTQLQQLSKPQGHFLTGNILCLLPFCTSCTFWRHLLSTLSLRILLNGALTRLHYLHTVYPLLTLASTTILSNPGSKRYVATCTVAGSSRSIIQIACLQFSSSTVIYFQALRLPHVYCT